MLYDMIPCIAIYVHLNVLIYHTSNQSSLLYTWGNHMFKMEEDINTSNLPSSSTTDWVHSTDISDRNVKVCVH